MLLHHHCLKIDWEMTGCLGMLLTKSQVLREIAATQIKAAETS